MALLTPLERVRSLSGSLETPALPRPRESAPVTSFGDTLKQMVNDINRQQVDASDTSVRFLAGEVEHVHEAMVSLQKARTSFTFMVEVRNRLLEGYKEVMRMQI